MNRFNVAIVAKFASKRVLSSEFIVATTHLLFNPKREDVRMAQLQVLLTEIKKLAVNENSNEPLPVILTGDLNSKPFSLPWQLINNGCVRAPNTLSSLGISDDCTRFEIEKPKVRLCYLFINCLNEIQGYNFKFGDSFNQQSDENADENILAGATCKETGVLEIDWNTGNIRHDLNLMSTIISNSSASTYQNEWITVDYIFYTKFTRRPDINTPVKYSPLQLLANYELPTKNQCHQIGLIPNSSFGSDHFSMASEFVLLNRHN